MAALAGWIYFQGQFLTHRFLTWLPKIEFDLDILDVGTFFLDAATQTLRDTAETLDGLGNFPRGVKVEGIADVNIGGNVTGIDDIRFAASSDDRAFVTSVRSHDVKSADALAKAIRSDANGLFDKTSRLMQGVDKNGDYRKIQPRVVKGKGLLVAIPWKHRGYLRQIAQIIDEIAETTETVIRVAPVRSWRGKK